MAKLIFIAFPIEAESILTEFGFRKLKDEPFGLYVNDIKNAYILLTGIGLENAKSASQWAMENLDFDIAYNVGAVGLLGESNLELGDVVEVDKVILRGFEAQIAGEALTLMSSPEPIKTTQERAYYGQYAHLVDMEAYNIFKVLSESGKILKIIKIVSDFSQECDIVANILKIRTKLNPYIRKILDVE